MSFDTAIYTTGPAAVIMPSQVQADPPPTEEVCPAGAGFWPSANYALSRWTDDPLHALPPSTVRSMMADPAVSSSYNTHKMGIISGGIKLVSPVKQPAWSKRPGAAPSASSVSSTEDTQARSLTPEQSLAKEIHEFCERIWARLKGKTGSFLFEFLDAMASGSKLAEVTFAVAEDGPDAGRLVFDRLAVKPDWAWRFVVDNKFKVVGILTYQPTGGYVVYPPDKFVWLSWMPRDSDPRGTSILTAARTAWNLKVQAWPQHYRHLVRFGSPGLDFMMAMNDTTPKPSIDATGALKNDGTTMQVGEYYATLLGVYQAGGIITRPNGSELNVVQPNGNGEAFQLAIDLYNREIMLAIEWQSRAALEAKHGSKADSGTAENRKDVGVQYGREWLAEGLYPAFKLAVRLNFGDDAAERMASYPTFGGTENANRAELWTAAASLGVTVGPSQQEEMAEIINIPIPDVEADQAYAMEMLQTQADLAAASKPQPGPAGASREKTASRGGAAK